MPNLSDDERAVAQRLLDGDESAFKLIFNNYKNKLYCFCMKFTKSEELAEEIVQDVFLKIWINRKKINPDRSFNAYVFKISKNMCLNFLKRAQLDLSIKRRLILNIEQSVNYTENWIMASENEQLLEKAIQRLPPQQQIVFRMCRIQGMSHAEISENLNLSKGTIKNYIMSAVTSISKFLHIHPDEALLLTFLLLYN